MASTEWDKLARVLAQWLEGQGVLNWESGTGGNTFTERILPSLPDDAVNIRSTGGFESGMGDDDEELPTIQVLARSKTPNTAINQLWRIFNVLHGARYVQLNEGVFLLYALAVQSGPTLVEQDAGGRYVYSTNYRLATEAVA